MPGQLMPGQYKYLVFVLVVATLSGCTSISRGITEAIVGHEVDDERRCWITGRSFTGLEDMFLDSADNDTEAVTRLKVMTVHGIGSHSPGHSRRLINGLVIELELTRMSELVKTIRLSHPEHPGDLGILSVYRYMNEDRSREVIFYELTWDSIVEEQLSLIEYDSSQDAAARRVPLNHTIKTFVNKSVPDALIYNTEYRSPIQASVAQSACWMLTERWDNLPHGEAAYCDASRPESWLRVGESNIAIISHSLGSRISLDAIQQTMTRIAANPELGDLRQKLGNKTIYHFMLSNQLPLLQVGQPLPEVHDEIGAICRPGGARRDDRLLDHLQIVAFSDPNDLFSYTVKPAFVDRYVDSRLCPTITNVVIEVAPVTSILGTEAFANPQSAHTGYDDDERVVKMLVSGFGAGHGQDEVRERCAFIETVPEN